MTELESLPVETAEPLAAALAELAGLLVDTEPLWTQAEHELAARLGGAFTPARSDVEPDCGLLPV